jgi:hypothetical protein
MSAFDVDDRQPTVCEPHRPATVVAVIVGTTVTNAIGHGLERLATNGSATRRLKRPANSAHD